MQKIEKWRVQELAIVLFRIADLLKKGGNQEWANVIEHFYQEAQNILLKENFDFDSLKRLIINIIQCYRGLSSFDNLPTWHESEELSDKINSHFSEEKAYLLKIIHEIEKKSIEYIN